MAITLDGTTGVTAAEFDGTVDASNLTGILPAIDGSALTGIDTSPPTTVNAVGTYIAAYPDNVTIYNSGSTVAGSTLKFLNTAYDQSPALGEDINSAYNPVVSSGLSGTWRAMGQGRPWSYQGNRRSANLFVRIS